MRTHIPLSTSDIKRAILGVSSFWVKKCYRCTLSLPSCHSMKAFRSVLAAQKLYRFRPSLLPPNNHTLSCQRHSSSGVIRKMPKLDVIKSERVWWKESVVYQVCCCTITYSAKDPVEDWPSHRSILHPFETPTVTASVMSEASLRS